MSRNRFCVCWTMDCESVVPPINNPELGSQAIDGYAQILEEKGWPGTFFVLPEEVAALPDLIASLTDRGHEVGMHLHPKAAGHPNDYLATFSADEQKNIVQEGMEIFEARLGSRPVSARPGYFSVNDSTFPVFAACGIRQTSASMPGRRMTSLASNWAGAPVFTHYANPHNRFLIGGLDLVEIPVSADWETMIWGGLHPQDLRIEYTDAKNQSFVIEKVMRRQVAEDLPLKALVILTHDIFRYDDARNFRRETMLGMIESIHQCANALGIELVGATIKGAAAAYRAAVPLDSK